MEYFPLDAKLQLPTGHMSYVLQEWSQTLATQMPYSNVNDILEMILNQSLSTHTLNRNNDALSQSVVNYHEDYPPAPLAKEEEIVVISADDKGIPMRCGSKKMSLVASVYTISPYQRSAEDIVQALFDEVSLPRLQVKRPVPIAKRVRGH